MATEKRLIDANALKAHFPTTGIFPDDLWLAAGIRMAIDNAHTIDAVEVVRCKDCKHCTPDENIVGGYGDCFYKDDIHSIVNADDFCSLGEREGNE